MRTSFESLSDMSIFLLFRVLLAAAMILDELGDADASQAIESAVRSVLRIAEMKRYAVSMSSRKEKRYPSKLFS